MTLEGGRPETPEAALAEVEKAIQHWCSLRMPQALLTGFVLHYGLTTLDDEGSPGYQVRYAVADSTDLVRAVGISDLGHRHMLADILSDD